LSKIFKLFINYLYRNKFKLFSFANYLYKDKLRLFLFANYLYKDEPELS